MINIGNIISEFAPGSLTTPQDDLRCSGEKDCQAGPKTSFFRGVAVGLAVAIPVWVWLIWSIL
jgi:hypothetical protein